MKLNFKTHSIISQDQCIFIIIIHLLSIFLWTFLIHFFILNKLNGANQDFIWKKYFLLIIVKLMDNYSKLFFINIIKFISIVSQIIPS